jgi:hypothetical protein
MGIPSPIHYRRVSSYGLGCFIKHLVQRVLARRAGIKAQKWSCQLLLQSEFAIRFLPLT